MVWEGEGRETFPYPDFDPRSQRDWGDGLSSNAVILSKIGEDEKIFTDLVWKQGRFVWGRVLLLEKSRVEGFAGSLGDLR